ASFVARHRPDIFRDATDDTGRAILFVARWNRQVESIERAFPRLPFRRVRIEDLAADGAELARAVRFLTGSAPSDGGCSAALGTLAPRIGSRGQRSTIDWRQIVEHPNGRELAELARDYGYATRVAMSGGAD
ncbi:MAG: hypothetical protein HYX32_15310, partial [Actinobacteria bacterium]|nr:hypothetical protein [Actinomycetota bacterium]